LTEVADSRGLAALLEAMLASSLDAVITIDSTGSVLTFNPAAEAMFGYTAPSVLGRDIAQFIIPPALRARHYAALARHLESGAETILNKRVELMGMRAEGEEFPVELTVTRVPLDGPPRFTAYVRDVTDRKRAEQELRESPGRRAGILKRDRLRRLARGRCVRVPPKRRSWATRRALGAMRQARAVVRSCRRSGTFLTAQAVYYRRHVWGLAA
jgi:PAS domain S-box-containing protein